MQYLLLSCRSRGIKIEGGQSYYLKITPQVHSATQSFNDLSVENRNCKLSKEIPDGSFLTSYSEQGCVFECVLRHAVSCITFRTAVPASLHISPIKCYFLQKQQTNCTPWDYPSPNGVDHIPLCTSYFDGKNYFNNLKSFDMVMRDSAVSDNCSSECLPNCEQVSYKWTMDTTDLDPHTLCYNDAEMREVKINTKIRGELSGKLLITF